MKGVKYMLDEDLTLEISDDSLKALRELNLSASDVSIDTLTFTLFSVNLDELFSFLKNFGFEFVLRDKGMLAYKTSFYDKHTSSIIATGGDYNHDSTYLYINGKGCTMIDSAYGLLEFIKVFYLQFSQYNLRCNRIDLCKDSFENFFYDWVQTSDPLQQAQMLLARGRTRRWGGELDSSHHHKPGWTYYSGKRDSGIFVRLYDKAVEQRVSDIIPYWARLEIEIKKDDKANYAQRVIDDIISGTSINSIFSNYAMSHFRICVPNDIPLGDHNRSRDIEASPEFIKFLGIELEPSQKLFFCELFKSISIQAKVNNIARNVLPQLLPLLSDMSFYDLISIFEHCCDKYSDKYVNDLGYSYQFIRDNDNLLNSRIVSVPVEKEYIEKLRSMSFNELSDAERVTVANSNIISSWKFSPHSKIDSIDIL